MNSNDPRDWLPRSYQLWPADPAMEVLPEYADDFKRRFNPINKEIAE